MSDVEIRFSALDIGDAEIEAVARVMRSGWITTGEECHALEAELAAYLDVEHVVAVASCTAALEIATAHLGLPPGSRVGVPTWTFVSTALAPFHRGLRPVPLDIELSSFNLCPTALRAQIDGPDGLDAVIGVHFAGTPLSPEIHQICADAGIPLIEDAAHALGASDHRGMVAGQGTAGACFSFYATKNLTSAEGGAIATDDPELAAFARSFRLHGLSQDAWARYRPGARSEYDIIGDGLKANLPDLLAAVARIQLTRFPDLQARRAEMDERYRRNLTGIEGLRLIPEAAQDDSAHHLMVVELPETFDRGVVQKQLSESGIGTSVHFRPLHTFPWFAAQGLESGTGGTPNADAVADRALSLPFHTRLTDHDIDVVCDALRQALAR